MRITLRQLAVFDAIARCGSVSKGAEEIALSQSAASMALKDLEDALQIKLFHRHGRHLVINSNGQRLRPAAMSILAQIREIEQLSTTDVIEGSLTLAASPPIADYFLPAICAAFLKAHPHVRIATTITTSRDVLDAVENMICDIGFSEAPCNRASLENEHLITDRLTIFCAASHPLAARRGISFGEAETFAWCLPPPQAASRTLLATKLTMERELILPIALETPSNQGLKNAVASGGFLGFMSSYALQREFETGQLVPLRMNGVKFEASLQMLRPKRVYRPKVQEAFAQQVRLFATRMKLENFDFGIPVTAAETERAG